MNMRIVVFGAGGFIGGWLCEELADRKDVELVACVRQWSSAVRLARRGLDVIQVDLEAVTEDMAVIAGADIVVNASMPQPEREPELAFRLYSACAVAGVRKFIQFSSMAVYGDQIGDVDEDTPLVPSSEYGRGKAEMEKQLLETAAESGPQLFILRPTIVYGPFSDTWTVRYARRIINGHWRSLGWAGSGMCNLVHVQDVAQSVVLAALAQPDSKSHVLNINGPELVTWNEYIGRFGDALEVGDRTDMNPLMFSLISMAVDGVRKAGCWVKRKGIHRPLLSAPVLIGRAQSVVNDSALGQNQGVRSAHAIDAIDGRSVKLDDETLVVLAGIAVPLPGDGAYAQRWAEQARRKLHDLVAGRTLTLVPIDPGHDRYWRLLAQASDDKGVWLQGELLRAGLARVWVPSSTADRLDEMLKLEREARLAKRECGATRSSLRSMPTASTGAISTGFNWSRARSRRWPRCAAPPISISATTGAATSPSNSMRKPAAPSSKRASTRRASRTGNCACAAGRLGATGRPSTSNTSRRSNCSLMRARANQFLMESLVIPSRTVKLLYTSEIERSALGLEHVDALSIGRQQRRQQRSAAATAAVHT